MSDKSRIYLLIFLIFIYLGSISKPALCDSPNRTKDSATDIIKESPIDSAIKHYSVSASEMLDSERRFSNGNELTALSDSLFKFIDGTGDTLQTSSKRDSIRTVGNLYEGMRRIGGDIQIDPQLRIISPRAHKLLMEDVRFVAFELLKKAISEYFEAKRLNPYNVNVEIGTYFDFYQKYRRFIVEDQHNEFQQVFLNGIQRTKWLSREIHDTYILQGKLYYDLKQWQEAYKNFDSAYQMVNKPLHPIGIDPMYAAEKDSIASKLFIANERQLMGDVRSEEARELVALSDSLWDFYEWANDSTQNMDISFFDSLMARKWMDRAIALVSAKGREIKKRLKKIKKRKYELRVEDLAFMIKEVMKAAEAKFLEAKRLSPFNLVIRINLIQLIYQSMGDRFKDLSNYQKAIDEMEHLLWVTKDRTGYYFLLGDYYRELKNWDKAYENYKQAENVLCKTALLSDRIKEPEQYFDSPETAPVDTLNLYMYTIRQAESRRRAYLGKEALELYQKALTMVPNEEHKENVEYEIKWINWDDGNIRASEVRDSASVFFERQEFSETKSTYLKLLGMLWTQRTRDEINWRIALIDFDRLDNQADGISRMRQVYDSIPKDSAAMAENPLINRYLQDYGMMCFVLGQRYFNDKDKLRAYVYFTQAAQIPWFGRPKAYLYLADLSRYDPRETIRLCELALSERENLTTSEMRTAATLLSESYTKEAEFKLAKEWHRKSLDKAWIEKKKI